MIKKTIFFHILIFFWFFKNFKNSYTEIKKIIRPITLELGHIAKDLKVGDKNIVKENNNSRFFSILSNLKIKHL